MTNDLLPPVNSGITPEEWQRTPGRVRDLVKELWEKVIQLQDTVEKLQEVVKRNSQNSSQPPSQDRPEQKPVKEKSGQPRKRGGQPHHRGHHRVLVQQADEIIQH